MRCKATGKRSTGTFYANLDGDLPAVFTCSSGMLRKGGKTTFDPWQTRRAAAAVDNNFNATDWSIRYASKNVSSAIYFILSMPPLRYESVNNPCLSRLTVRQISTRICVVYLVTVSRF